jgi:hypothetical protein
MAGVITTGNHPAELWPGVYAFFGLKYAERAPEYPRIFDVKDSGQNYEELVETYGFGLAPVKTQGGGTFYDSHAQGPTTRFSHVSYGLGYVVTREERDDNKYMELATGRAESLARSVRQTEENVGANVLNRATTAGFTGGDGVVLASASHPLGMGGTWSNLLSPGADFSEAAMEDLAIQIMNAVDQRNMKQPLMPVRLILPTATVFEAERVLQSQLQNDTANNAINALKAKGIIPEVDVNHYLTDSDAFHIKTDCPNGLLWFNRVNVEFARDNDFDTDNAKAKAYRRWSCGWANARGYYHSPGA